MRGLPVRVTPPSAALSEPDGRRLWEISESLTGVRYGALAS